MKKNNQGFTLIELIIVIVILGILAVTAAPRFLDLAGDARASTLQALEGATRGASSIVYSKSIVETESNIEKTASAAPAVEGILTHRGYPTAQDLNEALTLEADEWTIVLDNGTAADATSAVIFPRDLNVTAATVAVSGTPRRVTTANIPACYVIYTESAAANTAPVIDSVTGGCTN